MKFSRKLSKVSKVMKVMKVMTPKDQGQRQGSTTVTRAGPRMNKKKFFVWFLRPELFLGKKNVLRPPRNSKVKRFSVFFVLLVASVIVASVVADNAKKFLAKSHYRGRGVWLTKFCDVDQLTTIFSG